VSRRLLTSADTTRLLSLRRTVALAFLTAVIVATAGAGPAQAGWTPPDDSWQRLDADLIRFHHRADEQGLVRALAEVGPSTLEYISMNTGAPIPPAVDVILAPDQDSFGSLQPRRPPSWAAGTAWSDRMEIYLRADLPDPDPDRLREVFVHELTHVLVGQMFEAGELPRWLNEGLALLFAGELRPSDQAVLVRAAVTGSLLPMTQIARAWPTRAAHARLAYVQSVDFVSYVQRQRDDSLPTMVRQLASGRSLDQALREATGQDLRTLEASWKGRLTIWHALIPLLFGPGAFWGFATFLFLFAAWKRRRQALAKMDAMAEREAALDGVRETLAARGWDAAVRTSPNQARRANGGQPPADIAGGDDDSGLW